MREIKFRAWDKERKEMYTPEYISNDPSEVLSQVIMQFTGLEDKNRKEIYEGDILSMPNYDFMPDNGLDPRVLSSVVYSNGGFRTPEVAFTEVLDEDECSENCEVIGNIYENPELLK